MKTSMKLLAIFLLLVNGVGAVYGGFHLITDPTGSTLQMPLSFLENSPFQNYLIPGIILITVNGVFSFISLAAIFINTKAYPWFILSQGILLSGWIIVQTILLRMFYPPLHATFLAIGLCLAAIGYYLSNEMLVKNKNLHIELNNTL
jgi:hypothetical protein